MHYTFFADFLLSLHSQICDKVLQKMYTRSACHLSCLDNAHIVYLDNWRRTNTRPLQYIPPNKTIVDFVKCPFLNKAEHVNICMFKILYLI